MKLRSLLLVVCLLLGGKSIFCQNVVTDSTATVVSYWKKGDSGNYTLTQTKEKSDNGKIISKGSSISRIDFSVIDATEESYIINWRYAEIKVNGNEAQNPISEKFAKLVQGINFKYQTSELGEFQELLNWKEVQTSVFKIIDRLVIEYTDPQIAGVLNQTKAIFSTKESIEQVIMKDIQMLHGIYGGEYKLKQKVSGETELPNFLGGDPFPAILNVEMYDLDKEEGLCKIEVSQVVDKDKATKIIRNWIQKAGQSKDSGTSSINVSDKLKYEVELKNGWVKSLHHNRTSETNGLRITEIQELILSN
ncbi:MAG TPA: hypothetical protein VF622_14780 [Segetibacter sp.]|jgi:hypothetical protein